jgi:inhibitor of KinA sporulation pathway (predicted exonuclease)
LPAPHELSAAESAIADIEAYMQARFYPHIQKIADDAFGDFESPDLPPLVLARIDLKNFVEDVDEYVRPTVFPQLRSAVAGWINTMNQADVGAEFERLIEHHYEHFKSSLVLTAFGRLLDMTDTLKKADDKWRVANPEKAAQIPFDAFGPELGDLLAPYLKG